MTAAELEALAERLRANAETLKALAESGLEDHPIIAAATRDLAKCYENPVHGPPPAQAICKDQDTECEAARLAEATAAEIMGWPPPA